MSTPTISAYRYFRRYGLEDGYTIFLNAALLFTVMVYVYPLRFLFDFVVSSMVLRTVNPSAVRMTDPIACMQIYGVGFILIFVLFALMVHHAYAKRESLQLDEVETHLTKSSRTSHLLTAGVGVFSVALTIVLPRVGMPPGIASGVAGMSYALNGVVQWRHGVRTARGMETRIATSPDSPA